MSGHDARKGFEFQDLYLLLRVLRAASESLDAAWMTGAGNLDHLLNQSATKFGIEASPPADAADSSTPSGPDWDILVLSGDKLEFAEAKSGAIRKEDRIAFWRRLRRELGKAPSAATTVVPVLVVDPSASGDLSKWLGLAAEASGFVGQPPSNEPTANVFSANQLLAEALWSLCCAPQNQGFGPAVEASVARGLLSRFELHQHHAAQLGPVVNQFLELLFPDGLADTERNLLLGWLNSRATDQNPERRLFTVQELLGEIGILQAVASLTPGILKGWKDLWCEVQDEARSRTRIRLGRTGETISPNLVQAAGFDALSKVENRALVVLGRGGAGKSVFVAQAADAAEEHGDLVLQCNADNLNLEELEQLNKGLRFRSALVALRNPAMRLLLAVDALDEADVPVRKRWVQLLARLSSVPNLRVLVSIREADWSKDGETRMAIGSWPSVTLELWPEKIVRDLLKPTPFSELLPASVITLLRTPILLDVFWRTFVETNSANVSRASSLQTRHELLAAFWEERLLKSPRFARISDLGTRLAGVFSHAAGNIGAFSAQGLDDEVVQVLLSEGVFFLEGRLKPRLRFRHSLLRDFAFSQWCLDTDDCAECAARWNMIQGGLQQHSCLRAILEALSDSQAGSEYPRLNQGAILGQILSTNPGSAALIAQVLGTRQAAPEIDPARWTIDPRFPLPKGFGRAVLAAARMSENSTWAAIIEGWQHEASWLDEGFGHEAWNYTALLSERAKQKPTDALLAEASKQAARTLRNLSESPRFIAEFEKNNRWLKTQAMVCVIPVLPNEATLAWIERELTQPGTWNWSWLLERLAILAAIEPKRTAEVYRHIVGLRKVDGRHSIDMTLWGAVADHRAIEWSLAGEDGRRSLLGEHPAEFLPVALDLAEALWEQQDRDPHSNRTDIFEIVRQFDPTWSDSAYEEWERVRRDHLGDLIDDQPESYWRTRPGNSAYERCLGAIHTCAEQCAEGSYENFVSSIVPLLRSSQLASVHSVLCDILLRQKGEPLSSVPLQQCVVDSRLYYVFGMRYWLEPALAHVWSTLVSSEKDKVFSTIRGLIRLSESEHRAKRFLARIPEDDLPADLKLQKPSGDDDAYAPVDRPQSMGFHFEGQDVTFEPETIEENIGDWPEGFDREILQRFCVAGSHLQKKDASPETLLQQLAIATEAATKMLPKLRNHRSILDLPEHFWVWRALVATLNGFRRVSTKDNKRQPPMELVHECAEMALSTLEEGPGEIRGELSVGDTWVSPETPWVHALALADVSLTWSPADTDEEIQRRFVQILETAFGTGLAVVQLVCVTHVCVWHWLRSQERRELRDRLIWSTPKHAGPLVFALQGTRRYPDDDRARVYRGLLRRSGIEKSKALAHHLGRLIGSCGMVVFRDGRRSEVAELAREAVNGPGAFPLLEKIENQRTFFSNLTFGTKEQVKIDYRHSELAADFGDWNLKAWRILRSFQREGIATERSARSESVVYGAMHWLEEIRVPVERIRLQPWWHHLQPLFQAVVRDGGPQDNHYLFFNLHEGKYNDLTTPKELLSLIETFTSRIVDGATSGTLGLDETKPERGEHDSWRDCAGYAAQTIDSLRAGGSLQNELEREQAHRLLTKLAEEPVRAPKAVEARHRLQNE